MLILALFACGVTERNFDERFAVAWCPVAFECADAEELAVLYADEAECRAVMSSGAADLDACAFDARAAQDCLDAIEVMTCEEYDAGTPPACTLVCG
jgi:hypothetical protein